MSGPSESSGDTPGVADRAALEEAIEAMARGDLYALADYVDPEFAGIVPPDLSAEPDSYNGPDGIRRYFELFEETIVELRFEPTVLEEAGDWFLLRIHVAGTGRLSGIPMENEVFSAVRMRGTKLLRMEGYRTLEEAREAVADR